MTPLRGVMIGAGYFAQFHGEAWRRIATARVDAVVDADLARAQQFADRFAIPRVYASAEAMFAAEQPQFVDIVTRPESHLALASRAASHGAAVLCQKPMAPTRDECVQMCDVCEQAGVRLLIHENWRWQPWYREVKRLLADGICGSVLQVSFFWRTGDGRGPEPYTAQPYFRQMPRLLVYETLVHTLDTFRFLLGEMDRVTCHNIRQNPVIVGEDGSQILVSFAAGPLGLIDANRLTGPMPSPVAMGELWVEGDRATIRMSADGRLWIREHGQRELPLPFVPPATGYKGDSVLATQKHLIDCLLSGTRCESEGRDYLHTVELVDACYRSHETGRSVRVGDLV